MSNIIVKENETLDSALRRFKRSCAKAGIQQEIRKREHYEKPSVKRKKKSEAARKRKYNERYESLRVSPRDFFSQYIRVVKKVPRMGSHCGGMERCRGCDPPQVRNPARQDSVSQIFTVHRRTNEIRIRKENCRFCAGSCGSGRNVSFNIGDCQGGGTARVGN